MSAARIFNSGGQSGSERNAHCSRKAGRELGGGVGLNLVRRLRAGEAGDTYKKLPVIMVTSRNRASDIELARNAGVDEFVLRPFSTSAVLALRMPEILVEEFRKLGQPGRLLTPPQSVARPQRWAPPRLSAG